MKSNISEKRKILKILSEHTDGYYFSNSDAEEAADKIIESLSVIDNKPETGKTQCAKVLNALNRGQTIDTVWAFNWGICRLSARIMDLKMRGHKIESVPQSKGNRKLPYCGYRLAR